jgi:predicted outer membrane repeat protein
MRKFLTSLAAISLIGSLFLGSPAPVAAAGTGSVEVYALEEGDFIHADDSRENDGARQTYLSPAGTTMNMQIELIEDGDDADLVDTITFSLKNAVFAGTYNDDNGYGAYDDGDYNDDACYLDWTSGNKTTTPTATISAYLDCNAGTGADGAPDQRTYLNFDVVIPAGGSAVLTVDSAAADVKVFFFAAEDADDIYVGSGSLPAASGDGNCTNPDFSTVNAAQGSAEEAIFAALAGVDQDTDTIIVCEGTFEYEADIENYDGDDLYDGTLTIQNESEVDASDIVLDGNSNYNLLHVENASLVVTGLKFLDADVNDGGAAIFLDNGALYVEDSIFNSNNADGSGGAIKASISDESGIETSTFVNNDSGFRGGAVNVNSATSNTEYFYMEGNVFEGNSADDDGGALRTGHNVMLEIDDSEFTGNHSSNDYGGAIYAKDDATIGYSVFTENVAYDDGGAVFFDEKAFIGSSVFTRNEAGVNSGDDGGAIYGEASVQVWDSTFTSNFAGDEGGAMFADGLAGVWNSRFINNRSVEWAGAASFAESAWVWDTVFRGNKSRLGGAVDSWGERLFLVRSKFINNQATQWGGAIARAYDEGGITLVGDVDRTTIFRANRSSVGLPVALYYTEGHRLAARQAVHVWNAAGAQSHIVRKVHQFNWNFGG